MRSFIGTACFSCQCHLQSSCRQNCLLNLSDKQCRMSDKCLTHKSYNCLFVCVLDQSNLQLPTFAFPEEELESFRSVFLTESDIADGEFLGSPPLWTPARLLFAKQRKRLHYFFFHLKFTFNHCSQNDKKISVSKVY